MTELAVTSARMKELFELVDLEPMPQSDAVKEALKYWLSKRAGREAVPFSEIVLDDLPDYRPYLFLFLLEEGPSADYRLKFLGESLSPVLGYPQSGDLLSEALVPAFAERAAALFALSLERGDPVAGIFEATFEGADLYVEVMAAPLDDVGDGGSGVFGALAYRHPKQGWEDTPKP